MDNIDVFKNIVNEISFASKCTKRKVGCIIVKDNNIISSGINKTLNDKQEICEHSYVKCSNCNTFINIDEVYKKNTRYIAPCNTCSYNTEYTRNKYIASIVKKTHESVIHAEEGAIIAAAKNGIAIKDTIMFVTTTPCIRCARMIIEAGIKEVYYIKDYKNNNGKELLLKYNIKISKI